MRHSRAGDFFTRVIVPILSIIVILTLLNRNEELESELQRVEQELNDTQEQLLISNNMLHQIKMRNEREFYMDQVEEETNE